jgi:Amt family ammonium transporter
MVGNGGFFVLTILGTLLLGAVRAWAGEDVSGVNAGDTAWLMVSTALVMLMTPGLALFYGGMSRRKNVLNTIMFSFLILCLISVQWVLWGYTLAFGPDKGGIIGGLDFLGLRGVGLEPSEGSTIPQQLFMMFQGMFAVITPALITGAFVERFKFSTFLIFSLAWATLVYDPVAHWVWGGGWLASLGALDFAGGTVVHITSGVSALAAAIIIGRRRGHGAEPMHPNNLPMTVLGAGLLWFGWFGFNAGSALTSGVLAVNALVTTNTAAGAAAFTWLMVEWVHRGKPTVLGIVTGAVAGLVAITPAAGFVAPMSSILIGMGAGVFCYMAVVLLKPAMGYDDSLDVFGVHGVGGTWGAIATGLFASSAIPGSTDGLFFGNPQLLKAQIVAVVATWVFALAMTFSILSVLKPLIGLRVSEEDEITGLDLALHGESGYSLALADTSPMGRRHVGEISSGVKALFKRPSPTSASSRVPPKAHSGVAGASAVGGDRTPPRVISTAGQTVGAKDGPFMVEISGIDEKWLAEWWRDLCHMEWAEAPQAFKDIYGHITRFKEKVFSFMKGDPEGYSKKIRALLMDRGWSDFEVRVLR